MEQLPSTYNAGFAISIAIWQGKDYEIKITTKTPLVTMFSGGSGLKDKMENNQFKTSTLFFLFVCLFLNSSLVMITLSLSLKVHLWTGSLGIQSNLPLIGLSLNFKLFVEIYWTEEVLTVSGRIIFWHTEADLYRGGIIALSPHVTQFKPGGSELKSWQIHPMCHNKTGKNITIYLKNQQQH